jgi:hypothetical protein
MERGLRPSPIHHYLRPALQSLDPRPRSDYALITNHLFNFRTRYTALRLIRIPWPKRSSAHIRDNQMSDARRSIDGFVRPDLVDYWQRHRDYRAPPQPGREKLRSYTLCESTRRATPPSLVGRSSEDLHQRLNAATLNSLIRSV